MRRVVVTGLGLVTPLACGVEETWSRLLAGQSGAGRITRFDPANVITQYACEVPLGDGTDGTFNPDDWMEPKDRRKVDDFILYGMAAAVQAVRDSGWQPASAEDRERTGVMIGSGIGGLQTIAETAVLIKEKGTKRVSPFFIPGSLINLISGQVSIRFGFKGPNHAVVTACSTGAHAIGDAARLIQWGDADVMVAGGAEAPICEIGIAGFNACKALSTKRGDDPQKASRPYDADRDGFVMGEGAGVVVLEEYEHAKARGAKIHAEVLGYGLSGDAHHITAPSEDGEGGYRSMQMALKRAGITPAEVDYINAHGTSTMADTIELGAVERLLGDAAARATMSSTKSSIGHLLGAAGAVEAIFCVLAIRDQIAPPTINLDNPAVAPKLDLAPNRAVKRRIDVALSNSFGFGGTNASLVLGRVQGLMWRSVASNALTLFIVVLVIAAGILAWGRQAYVQPGPLTAAVCFKVEKGASLAQISRALEEQGVVSDARILRIGVEYSDRAGALKYGSYLIGAAASMQEVVAALTEGGQSTCGREVNFRIGVASAEVILRELDPGTNRYVEVVKFDPAAEAAPAAYLDIAGQPDIRWRVTLAEGVTSWQVADALKRADFLDGKIAALPAEGTLAPDSYEVDRGAARADLLAEMEKRQAAVLAELWAVRAEGLPYETPAEALVMASIVEKETGVAEERKLVASVFLNRLAEGMRLQTDPTVIYGITGGEGVLGRGLRQSELQRETPWNTYLIDGLPPTPIANPGRLSIEAALNPAATDYLYFVADGTGGHAFAATLAEHNDNVAKWRAIEAGQAGDQDESGTTSP